MTESRGGVRVDGAPGAAQAPGRPVRVRAPDEERTPGSRPSRDAPVPVLYVAGIGRSGSTLLARALGEVDGLVAAGEVMHFFGRGVSRDEYCACGKPIRDCRVWGEVARRLEAEHGPLPAPAIDRFRDRVTEGPLMPAVFCPWRPSGLEEQLSELRGWLDGLYRTLRDVSGGNVLVDSSKNAAYARILQGVPGVRLHLIHLVRDSRGVANSLRKWKRRPGTNGRSEDEFLDRRGPLSASLFWNAAQLLVEGLREEADGYRRVRYRDFVRRPAVTLGRILEMVPDRDGADGRHELDHVAGRRLQLTRHHVLAGNPVREETGTIALREDVSWREKLEAPVRTLVSSLTLPLLRRYGYSLE